MFASESMINNKPIGRKDDIESLLYVLCYLKSGTLPVIEYINDSIEVMDMNQFFNYVFKYRETKSTDHRLKVKELLGCSMASAFGNIQDLKSFNKPDYKLLKFLIATTQQDELKNKEFNQMIKGSANKFPVFTELEYKPVLDNPPSIGSFSQNEDNEPDFEFDREIEEMEQNDKPIGYLCNKIDNHIVRIDKLRELIVN